MNWDQIESKWADMTRRVQSHWSPRASGSSSALAGRAGQSGTGTPATADHRAGSQPQPAGALTAE